MDNTQKEAFKRTRLELQRIADSLETNSWPADALYVSMAAQPDAEMARHAAEVLISSNGENKDAERLLRTTLNRLRMYSAQLVESV